MMENCARDFDRPHDSPEHQLLAETAWMGGPLIAVRFYLGRLIGKNLFRVADAEVEEYLVQYISETTSHAGGELVRGLDGWQIASDLLRCRSDSESGKQAHPAREPTPKAVIAVEEYLTNSSLTMAQLAELAKTTEKQLGRNSLLNSVRWAQAKRNRRDSDIQDRSEH